MSMTTRKAVCSSTSRGGGSPRAPWLLLAALLLAVPAVAQEPADLIEGRRLFDALEYEQAMPLLDRAVALLEPQALRDPASRAALISAFEMRARARFGMGNREGAVSDFRALLSLEPGFELPEGVSPRVVALLAEVKLATIGTIELTLDPADAELVVDGVPRTYGDGRLAVAAGAHTLRVARVGFRPIDQPVTVLAGQSLPLRIALERVASVVTIITTPPDAEVFVNGVSKGRTEAGLPAAAAAAADLQSPADQVAALVLTDLSTGSYDVELRRDCYVTERRRITIAEMGDLRVEPVALRPSVGSLVLDSEPAGATVLVNGDTRGTAPLTIDGVCAGTHIVEFRTSVGRSVERVSLEPGASLTIRGRVRPAFALLAAEGEGVDPRLAVERAFAPAETLLLYAPPADVARDAVVQSGASPEWFGLGAPGSEAPGDLRDRVRRLADSLGAQGVAWVHPVRAGSTEVRLALLAQGSTEPDELTVAPDSAASVKQALDRLQTPLVLTRSALGATLIDVLDVRGAVVVDVEEGQAAAEAGLAPGDLVQQLQGERVDSAIDLESRLGLIAPDQQVALEVRTAAGEVATRTATLRRVPALVTTGDRFLPANVTVAALRALLATTSDPALQPIVRLNLAAALLRAGDAAEAQALLRETTLPPGPGVSAGTVQYLLGEAALAQGDQAGARQAWEAASQADGRLTSDGPAIKALAARALERLR